MHRYNMVHALADCQCRFSVEVVIVVPQHVRVSVDGTIVTLSGQVRSWHEKKEAERAAWASPGVTRVEDLIVVTP